MKNGLEPSTGLSADSGGTKSRQLSALYLRAILLQVQNKSRLNQYRLGG